MTRILYSYPDAAASSPSGRDNEDVIVDLSAHIVKADGDCVGSGRFGDVYKGIRNDKPIDDPERIVAIKVIRPITANEKSKSKVLKQLNREIAVWQGLAHNNIVPFLGVSNSFGKMPALISGWMDNGQLNDYLAAHPDANRSLIAEGLASGLLYLHTRDPKITHGDVKTANTLVDREGNPKLCDFGLSRLICEEDLWMTTTVNSRGSVRWMAPELLDDRQILPTPESDVYAFGMTVMEMLTGRIPYHHHRTDGSVLLAVAFRKELPSRPTEIDNPHLWQVDLDELWECLTECWDNDPGKRPTMATLEELFRSGREEEQLLREGAVIPPKSFKFIGHMGLVMSVTFSPDSRQIVSGSFDGSVRVWNVRTGKVVLEPLITNLEKNLIYSVTFSPDGKHLSAGCYDKRLRVWDAVTGKLASKQFVGHTDLVRSIAYSPDGKRIASGSDDKTVRVWNAETGKAAGLFAGHTRDVMSVAFSPDGKTIASGSIDGTVRVWDTETGEVTSEPFEGHKKFVNSVAFSPDGKRIASGSSDRSVLVWDAKTGKVVSGPFEGHTKSVMSVAFSPDGKRIVSGSYDRTVLLWDALTGKVVSGPFEGHTDDIYSVAFSPDGNWIASGSQDATVRVWDART